MFFASASWQLLLAGGGATAGQVLRSPTGKLGTGIISSLMIAWMAVYVLLS